MDTQELINILKRLGIYDKFIYNCLNYPSFYGIIKSHSGIIDRFERFKCHVVDNVFIWSNSPEGYDYWLNINRLFILLYHKKNYYGVAGKN